MNPYFIAESSCLKTNVYAKAMKTILLFKQVRGVPFISLVKFISCRQFKGKFHLSLGQMVKTVY